MRPEHHVPETQPAHICAVVQQQFNHADLAPAHSHDEMIWGGHEPILEQEFQHAVEPGINGYANGGTPGITMVVLGGLACFQPCFGLEQAPLTEQAAKPQRGFGA